jgi:hypothetical protein
MIYGRKCVIKEVSPKNSNKFLVSNHIQGKDKASVRIGLYHNDELVSIMTFCKSRYDKNIQWEMSRYCNKIGHGVIGGASKLFKYFISKNTPKTIVSYSDRRYFTGEIYSSLGFDFIRHSPPNYHYITDNYNSTQSRQQFQKHLLADKLELFNPELTEWENMKMNGFDRIWDCGNSKWIWSS